MEDASCKKAALVKSFPSSALRDLQSLKILPNPESEAVEFD